MLIKKIPFIFQKIRKEGKGNLPHASDSLTDKDIDIFYEKSLLGTNNPDALLRTLHRNNMTFFGMRSANEHRNLRWGDVKLNEDASSGLKYLEFITERVTKTRQGENPRNRRQINPKAFEIPELPERCPVRAYEIYKEKRPQGFDQDDDPYYLAANPGFMKSGYWFKKQPVGVNKIMQFVPRMVEIAGVGENRKLTNTSYRKQLAYKLNENNVPKEVGRHVTGHKHASSLDNYSVLTTDQQHYLSDVVGGAPVKALAIPNSEADAVNTPSARAVVRSHEFEPPIASSSAFIASEERVNTNLASGRSSQRIVQFEEQSSSRHTPTSLLSGAMIQGGTFNITVNNISGEPATKKRKYVIYSSSDDDN